MNIVQLIESTKEKIKDRIPVEYHVMAESCVFVLFGVFTIYVIVPWMATWGGYFAVIPFLIGVTCTVIGLCMLGCELVLFFKELYHNRRRPR